MKYKRLLSAVIIVVLMLAFTGCNAGVISNAPPPASENTTVSDTTEKESETATSVSTSAASTGKPKEAEASQSNDGIKVEFESSSRNTTEKSKSTSVKNGKSSSTGANTKTTNKGKIQPTQKNETTSTTKKQTDPTKLTCTITIDSKQALSNQDKLPEGHEEYLPKDGIFVNSYICTFKEGDTAFDLIKKVADAYGLKLTIKKTQFGKYISGINNIDQFDGGPSSGWIYYVNQKFARTSTDNYKVKNGDVILLTYTCRESDNPFAKD